MTKFYSNCQKAIILLAIFCMPAGFLNIMPTKAATASFPAGTYVIPMDDKQADRVQVFGLIARTVLEGGQFRRILESDSAPGVTLKTTANPGGASYQGGPILVSANYAAAINIAKGVFPGVTVDTLTEGFTSNNSFLVTKMTRILAIQGIFGHVENTLGAMGIPFTLKTQAEILFDPSLISTANFDLIIDDCPGAAGALPDSFKNAAIQFAQDGGELIFTDIALLDLDQVFPGYVTVVDDEDGTFNFTQHNNGSFISQYYGTNPFAIYTMGSGDIVSATTSPAVNVFLDSNAYGVGEVYRIGGFYFNDGAGIVEGLAFHPADQVGEAQILTSFIFGNKFIHTAEVPESLAPTGESTFNLYLALILSIIFTSVIFRKADTK